MQHIMEGSLQSLLIMDIHTNLPFVFFCFVRERYLSLHRYGNAALIRPIHCFFYFYCLLFLSRSFLLFSFLVCGGGYPSCCRTAHMHMQSAIILNLHAKRSIAFFIQTSFCMHIPHFFPVFVSPG